MFAAPSSAVVGATTAVDDGAARMRVSHLVLLAVVVALVRVLCVCAARSQRDRLRCDISNPSCQEQKHPLLVP